jgi:predicted metal-dependent hydrolase
MQETIKLGDVVVALTRKDVKHVHLSVHPPAGRVTLVAPHATRTEVARAYAITKLGWIREQRLKLNAQAREAPRQFVSRESHYLWGRRYLLEVTEVDEKPAVKLSHRRLTLQVRPNASAQKRAEVIHEWHKAELHTVASGLIKKWESKLSVRVSGYFLQRMRTKWGSCNHAASNIRLNTELVKKPKDLVEYVVVHEMLHLLEPTRNDQFVALLNRYWPQWRESRKELNALPLAHEAWTEQRSGLAAGRRG